MDSTNRTMILNESTISAIFCLNAFFLRKIVLIEFVHFFVLCTFKSSIRSPIKHLNSSQKNQPSHRMRYACVPSCSFSRETFKHFFFGKIFAQIVQLCDDKVDRMCIHCKYEKENKKETFPQRIWCSVSSSSPVCHNMQEAHPTSGSISFNSVQIVDDLSLVVYAYVLSV